MQSEISAEMSGDFVHRGAKGEGVNMAHTRGEHADLVVEASSTERMFATRRNQIKGVNGLLGLTCGPSEFTLYSFSVQADGVRWVVKLRYSDFVEFDRQLRRNFTLDELAGLGILPEKTFLQNSGSSTLIETRKVKLQTYLNRLSNSPAVMRSGLLRDFLKFPEEDLLPVETGVQARFTPGAYAVCLSCKAYLQAHKDNLDLGVCSVCSRHRLWGSTVD